MRSADELTLGELIRRQRLMAGWTQKALARKLGRSTAAVSQFESDSRCPGAKLIPELASILAIDRRRLVGLIMDRGWKS